MTEKVYDTLAIIGRLVLPALGTLYFALAKIWGLPLAEEIVGTISAVTIFLNTILKIEYQRWEDEQDINDLIEELKDEDDN